MCGELVVGLAAPGLLRWGTGVSPGAAGVSLRPGAPSHRAQAQIRLCHEATEFDRSGLPPSIRTPT
ncbi:hypothetical protein GCM10010377_52390 [Streptomyces viridiviolaceus]|nr:hypothetical protein GCM10010377_52390 [Streptomyces viridiviolaceus]